MAIASCMALVAACGDADARPGTSDSAEDREPQNGGTGQEAGAGGGNTSATDVNDGTTTLGREEKPPQCELPPSDTDPCHACVMEHCCGDVIGRFWEGGVLTWKAGVPEAFYPGDVNYTCFNPGFYGGPCIRDDWNGYGDSVLTRMQTCFEDKIAMGSTAESLDIIRDCLCEGYDLDDYDPGAVCNGPLDRSPSIDDGSPRSNFIACLLWPLEGEEDAGASETPSVSPCAEICFPGWH